MTAAAIAVLAAAIITGTPAEATWIHNSLAGGITASGAVYDPSELVCAANGYEFGTRLRITDRRNGRSTWCTVVDQGDLGPVNIDLSPAAFGRIGDLREGRIRVLIEVIE